MAIMGEMLMTPKEIERATLLLKGLEHIRNEIREWAKVPDVSISAAADEYHFAPDARPVIVRGERAKCVLSYVFESLKTDLDATEAELQTLGVEFERQELIVGAVTFGAAFAASPGLN